MRDSKGALIQEKLVMIILIALVLAVILYFLFGAKIQNWIYNLPSYNVPKEDVEIDLTNQNDIGIETQCKEGNIIGRETNPIVLGDKATNLYLNFKSAPTIRIFVTKKLLGVDKLSSDVQIGEFEQWGKIKIFSEILEKGELYAELKDYFPNYKYLVNLNDAYYIRGVGGNFICRDEVIKDEFNYALGTKGDPYVGFEINKKRIEDKINKKESFYFRTSGTKPEDFYFHYSPDMTQPIVTRENVWMYDSISGSDRNIKIFYPIDKMMSLPKNDEARDVIDLILFSSRGAS
ncbi:MAG: hypothetical protein WC584_03130 [Candidatus Pacearchaeota archaeon]